MIPPPFPPFLFVFLICGIKIISKNVILRHKDGSASKDTGQQA